MKVQCGHTRRADTQAPRVITVLAIFPDSSDLSVLVCDEHAGIARRVVVDRTVLYRGAQASCTGSHLTVHQSVSRPLMFSILCSNTKIYR